MTHLLSAFPTSVFSGLLIFCLSWWVITLLLSGLGGHGHAGHGHGGHDFGGHSGGNDFSSHAGQMHAGGHAAGGHTPGGHASPTHTAGGHASPTHTGPSHASPSHPATTHAAPTHTAPAHAGPTHAATTDAQHGHGDHAGTQHANSHHGHHAEQAHGFHGFSHAFGFDVVPLPLVLTLFAFGAWATSILMQTFIGTSDTAKVATAAALGIIAAATVMGFGVIKLAAKPLGAVFEMTMAPERYEGVGSVCKIRTTTVTETFGDAIVVTGTTKGSIVRVRAPEGQFARGDLALMIDYDDQRESFMIHELDEELRPDGQ